MDGEDLRRPVRPGDHFCGKDHLDVFSIPVARRLAQRLREIGLVCDELTRRMRPVLRNSGGDHDRLPGGRIGADLAGLAPAFFCTELLTAAAKNIPAQTIR